MLLSRNRWFPYLLKVGTIALAYFLSARLVLLFIDLQMQGMGGQAAASPVWPPAGIALAALVLLGQRYWPGVAIGSFLFALAVQLGWPNHLLHGHLFHLSRPVDLMLVVALGSACGSALEALVGAYLLRWINFHPALERLRDALGLMVLGAGVAPIVSATILTLIPYWVQVLDKTQLLENWGTTWLGDGMGVLVVTPVLLTWKTWCLKVQRRRRVLEFLLWLGLLVGITWLVFACRPLADWGPFAAKLAHYPLEYLPFPLLVWAALRFGQQATVFGNLIVSAIAMVGAVQGQGPFVAESNNLKAAILLLQAFMGVMAITSLVLATAVAERQKVEKALRESEERFRSMFEGAAIGIGLDNLDGRVVESNPALQAMLGYSREELAGLTFSDFTHPDDLDTDIELFREMIAGSRDYYQMEKRHIRKDGQPVWVRLTNSLVRDGEGKPRFTIGMVEDISDRKQTEEALQQSEARFRVVAETAACAILVYQGERFRYVNSATEVITGYSREELLEMQFWQLAHPEFRPVVQQRGLARQRGEAVPSRYEIKILTKTGESRWVDYTAGFIHFEGQPAALGTAYDITDRKRVEAKLQLAARRDRLLAEIAARIRQSLDLDEILNTTVAEIRHFLQADRVFISHLDKTGRGEVVAESVDPEYRSVLGWASEPEDLAALKTLFCGSRVRVNPDSTQMTLTPFLSQYYEQYQVKAGIGATLMLDGRVFGVLIVNQCSGPRDWLPYEVELLEQLATQVEIAIQQAQLYQQVQALNANLERQVADRTVQLQQKMEELQDLNQLKDILIHAVSHDLRTPMMGTLMVLRRLQSKPGDPVPVSRSILDCMTESSDRQLSLIKSLLEDYASDEPGTALHRQPVSMASVVQASLESLQPLLAANQTIVVNQIPADLPPAQVDPLQIQRVWDNLITNAVKHNCPGITVTLKAEQITSEVTNLPMLRCWVTDDGMGLAPDQQDQLFKLYVRGVHNCRLTGIGLGLYLCRQTINAHHGQIGVDSQPDTGASFWFTLPLA